MGNTSGSLLLVEPHEISRIAFAQHAEKECLEVEPIEELEKARHAISRKRYDFIFVALDPFPSTEGGALIHYIRSANASLNQAAYLLAAGTDIRLKRLVEGTADHFMLKPFSTEEFRFHLRSEPNRR